MIGLIISTIISGLIVGALGRLAIPGPNPMSIGMTILVGIGGAFVGGLIGAALTEPDNLGVIFILQVIAAAGIIYLIQRRGVGAGTTRRDNF